MQYINVIKTKWVLRVWVASNQSIATLALCNKNHSYLAYCQSHRVTNLMSLVIKFYFTSSTFNMFRTLIHLSSGACDVSVVSPHWLCVLVSICVGVSVWLLWGGIRVAGWSLLHGAKPHRNSNTHRIKNTRPMWSQAPDDECINVRNMLNIEEVK